MLITIYRGGSVAGVLDSTHLEMSTSDPELLALFVEAVRKPGMFSLGGPHGPDPDPAPGLCADFAHYTQLVPGDIAALFEFKRFILAKGYTTGDCHEKRS
jgi:hypothetical protein